MNRGQGLLIQVGVIVAGLTKKIFNRLERNLIAAGKRASQSLQGRREVGRPKQVVFVAGVHRSGTNMLMRILARSYRTEVFDETDPRAFQTFMMRERAVIHGLVDQARAPIVVVKALHEGHQLVSLLEEFAPAKAVWMFRHYDDMVNSHMVRWPGFKNEIDRIVEDPDSAAWRGRGMSAETLALVRRHHSPDMNVASAIALFWLYRNRLFFDQGFDRDARVLLLRYESLATDPGRHLPVLTDFLGIPATRLMRRVIRADSVRKQTAPEIAPDIRALCEDMRQRLEGLWAARLRPEMGEAAHPLEGDAPAQPHSLSSSRPS